MDVNGGENVVMKYENDKGFTMVEILAALTILGIVFISYMTIFPQMSNMNAKTETKLASMNIARQELANLKKHSPEWPSNYKFDSDHTSNSIVKYKSENGIYDIEVSCSPREDGNQKEKCSKSKNESILREENLFKIHIEVKEGGKVVSQTFGYVKLK